MKNAIFSLLAAASLFAGCNSQDFDSNVKTPVQAPEDQTEKAVELYGKSFYEVMALKYNRAEIKCTLFTFIGKKEGLRSYPKQAEFILNLKNDLNLPVEKKLTSRSTSLVVNGKSTTYSIEAIFVVKQAHLGNFIIHDIGTSNYTYQMINSPKLEMDVWMNSTTTPTDQIGEVIGTTTLRQQMIYENRSSILNEEKINYNDEYISHSIVDCNVETEIKTAYANQYKKDLTQ